MLACREETVTSVLAVLVVPNTLLVVCVAVLVYWYCPYCEARYRPGERDPPSER